MRLIYELSVWLHIVTATIWVGGMLFLVMVIVPWLRSRDRREAAGFLRETGRRFRNIGWACFLVFLITGIFSLQVRGVRIDSFFQADWLASDFGRVVLLKIGVFGLILAVSFAHDFVLGPRASAAIENNPRSETALTLRRRASLLGRFNVLLGLCAILLGVMVVRGVPV